MPIENLFWTYLHSPRLLDDLQEEFGITEVEDLLDWLNTYPAGSEAVLMDYFEDYKELKFNCEAMLISGL